MSDEKNEYDLSGKNIIITGATSGIGLAAAKQLAASNAFVIGVGRSAERNQQALDRILSLYPQGKVKYLLADLSSQSQVRTLADEIKGLLNKKCVDVLVNNAGVYLEKKQITKDGIEKTFAVNHLAPFLLTQALRPLLSEAEKGRVLSVSSYSHYTTPLCLNRIADPWLYIGLLAYKRSKLCNVLFTYEFNRRFEGITAFAVDPGLVNTAIASKGSKGISHLVWRSRRKQGTSPDVPTKTIMFLCGEEHIDTRQGYYFKNCEPKKPSCIARKPEPAKKLWALSCRLTGFN